MVPEPVGAVGTVGRTRGNGTVVVTGSRFMMSVVRFVMAEIRTWVVMVAASMSGTWVVISAVITRPRVVVMVSAVIARAWIMVFVATVTGTRIMVSAMFSGTVSMFAAIMIILMVVVRA